MKDTEMLLWAFIATHTHYYSSLFTDPQSERIQQHIKTHPSVRITPIQYKHLLITNKVLHGLAQSQLPELIHLDKPVHTFRMTITDCMKSLKNPFPLVSLELLNNSE